MTPEKKNRIAIIDLGLGNLFSVKNACEYLGADAILSSDPNQILKCGGAILPGVGAYGDAMQTLELLSLKGALKEFVESGKPFMGICLGMQILTDYGTEFGLHNGLGFIKGHAECFRNPAMHGRMLKIPEVCWNQLFKNTHSSSDPWDQSPLQGLPDGVFMYFNHSYLVIPDDPEIAIAKTRYGDCTFCSAVKSRNIFGIQCHPERSGKAGLQIYKSFLRMIEQSI